MDTKFIIMVNPISFLMFVSLRQLDITLLQDLLYIIFLFQRPILARYWEMDTPMVQMLKCLPGIIYTLYYLNSSLKNFKKTTYLSGLCLKKNCGLQCLESILKSTYICQIRVSGNTRKIYFHAVRNLYLKRYFHITFFYQLCSTS